MRAFGLSQMTFENKVREQDRLRVYRFPIYPIVNPLILRNPRNTVFDAKFVDILKQGGGWVVRSRGSGCDSEEKFKQRSKRDGDAIENSGN